MTDWGMLKPVLTALVLPPVPLLVLILLGSWMCRSRRMAGLALVWLGVVGLWLCACPGTAVWVQDALLRPGPRITVQEVVDLAARLKAGEPADGAPLEPLGIIVLGAGRTPLSLEYGMADLSAASTERLRYGIWLSRQSGVPVGFSGGVGWAQKTDGSEGGQQVDAAVDISEAAVAATIAKDQFGWPMRWVEGESADTRQNAARTVDMLSAQGVRGVVVVTHAFHAQRARRAFEEAAETAAARHPGAARLTVAMASMGYWGPEDRPILTWLPSASGMRNVNFALRECVGFLMGM